MQRRYVLGAGMYATTQTVLANGFLEKLKGEIGAIQTTPQGSNAPARTTQGQGQTGSLRFEEGVSLATYQRTFEKNFKIPSPRAIESPIRGLGLVKTPQGYEPTFLNSNATFFGARKWFTWGETQSTAQEMPLEEQERVRQELMGRLRWEMLVGPVWGQGVPRKAVVYSAPDCPFCLSMERELAAAEKKLGYELYYLPTMLAKGSSVPAQIWCSNNKPVAWLQAIARQPISASPSCDQEYYSRALADALAIGGQRNAAGQVATPTPTVILESGERGNWSTMKARLLSA